MINAQFYTYRRIHFTSGRASFLWYLSWIIREGRESRLAATWSCIDWCLLIFVAAENLPVAYHLLSLYQLL